MEHFAHKESPLPTPYNPVTLSCTESRLIYYCTPNARSGAPKLQSWVEDVIRFDFRRLPSPATPQLHLSCLNHLESPKPLSLGRFIRKRPPFVLSGMLLNQQVGTQKRLSPSVHILALALSIGIGRRPSVFEGTEEQQIRIAMSLLLLPPAPRPPPHPHHTRRHHHRRRDGRHHCHL